MTTTTPTFTWSHPAYAGGAPAPRADWLRPLRVAIPVVVPVVCSESRDVAPVTRDVCRLVINGRVV